MQTNEHSKRIMNVRASRSQKRNMVQTERPDPEKTLENLRQRPETGKQTGEQQQHGRRDHSPVMITIQNLLMAAAYIR